MLSRVKQCTSFFGRHVKKIEKLEFQLEEIMYEKDKIVFQWENAKRVKTKRADKGGVQL